MRTKIVLLPLFTNLQVATDGTDVASYLDIDSPDFKHLLAVATSITLHSLTFGAPGSNEFEWNVVFRSGYNRANETADINKIGPSANVSTNGSGRASAFTDTTKMMLESRLQILLKNKSGVSGVRSACISATPAIETVGM